LNFKIYIRYRKKHCTV